MTNPKSSCPTLVPLIASLPSTTPFVGPETMERQRGRPFLARLGANENGFGPSPFAVAAMQDAAFDSWCYGDPENYELKAALSVFHDIPAECLSIGAGVDALLGLIVRQYVEVGDIVINALGGYPTFNYHVAGFGGQLIHVPYKDDRSDLKALSDAAIKHKAKIVYLANPDNPLGTWYDAQDIRAFLDSLPSHSLVILDEAYCEMMPDGALLPLGAELSRPNLIRMRTFSKAYGLAGMRCGYAIGNASLISIFDRIRDHFSINLAVQKGALAALHDRIYFKQVIENINLAKKNLCMIADSHGLKTLPSATNFVAIDCGRDGAFANRVYENMLKRDIFIRKPMAPVIDRLIRVSVGPEKDMQLFAEALGPALKDAAQK